MLKIRRIVGAGIIENNILRDVLVSALVFVFIGLGRSSACGRVIPSITRAATSSASVVVVPRCVSHWRVRIIIFLLNAVPHDSLLFGDVVHADGHYHDNDGERKPRVLRLNTRRDGDNDNGNVSRNSDEHGADWLSFDFEFHLESKAPVILMNMLERGILLNGRFNIGNRDIH